MFCIKCVACGHFLIDEMARLTIGDRHPLGYILSALTRQATELGHQPLQLTSANIDDYLSESHAPSNFMEKLDLILLYILQHSKRAGDWVNIDFETDYPIAFSKDSNELEYMLKGLKEIGYLEVRGNASGSRSFGLTPKG